MKFRAPTAAGRTSSGAGRPHGRPDWLREWLASKGHYVRLSCGCKEDLNYRGLLIIVKFGLDKGKNVMCERCNDWASVTGSLTVKEYFGSTAAPTSQDPLF